MFILLGIETQKKLAMQEGFYPLGDKYLGYDYVSLPIDEQWWPNRYGHSYLDPDQGWYNYPRRYKRYVVY